MLLASSSAHAQAELAPESYEPPAGVAMTPSPPSPAVLAAEAEAKKRLWVLTGDPRFVVSMGSGKGVPRYGYGVGVSIARALFVRGTGRIGLGFSFSYERVQHDEHYKSTLTQDAFDLTHSISHAAFSLDLRLDGLTLWGRVRPWVLIGPAFSIGNYAEGTSRNNNQVTSVRVLPAMRVGAGVGVDLVKGVEVGLHLEVLPTFNGTQVGMLGTDPFTPGNFSLGIDVGFRF